MPRNAEVIRQWTMLRELERSRGLGLTVDELAHLSGVTTRTVRRDLQALEEAGFPIFDDKSHDDGRTRWRVNGQSFKGLAAGLTLSEVCALYFSRTLVQSLAGTPFRDDVDTAFEKLAAVLTPHMRTFLDQLPRVIATKADATAKPGGDSSAIVARALDATLHLRQARIVYHSKSSDRTKPYLVHPYKLAYANGASYLLAYVPDYGEVRTFAIDRIREMSLLEERFTPIEELPDTAFPHSLGVHSGPPERVEIEFQPSVADYIRSRVWHASQKIDENASGALRMTLEVCIDRALQSWILSFGPFARVVAPESLVRAIAEQFEEARQRYVS
ncbi:MAG TPA: WYL domain-containing protein [Vicinamibacterales bacterium]|nr:WYL domain-containing protein [Vicinamibacterales bacterium]